MKCKGMCKGINIFLEIYVYISIKSHTENGSHKQNNSHNGTPWNTFVSSSTLNVQMRPKRSWEIINKLYEGNNNFSKDNPNTR